MEHGRDHQGEGVARGAREKGHKGVKLGDILRYQSTITSRNELKSQAMWISKGLL